MTKPLVRFDFGTEFDEAGGGGVAPIRVKRSYTPEEVETLRAAAFAEGERSSTARAEQAAAAALAQIAANAQAGLSHLAAAAHEHKASAAALALSVGRKIADAALAAYPAAPAKAAFEALEREIAAEPRLVVRAAPELADRISAELEAAAARIGFAGRIEARPDPAIPPAAFSFDWGDGAASFDPAAASERIAAAIEAALAADAPISSKEA